MCGEKELAQYVPVQYVGSPPHVRGKARLQSKEEP